MSNEERQAFLNSDIDESANTSSSPENLARIRNIKFLRISVFINVILAGICLLQAGIAALVLISAAPSASLERADLREIAEPYSPANSIVEYEYREVVGNDTRFTGRPGPEWEKSIHELMKGTLIRISDEELKLYGSSSIPFKDGGYAAGLGVAHNLHCVKKLKEFIYREDFFPELDPTGAEFEYLRSHADHCLDFLRQSILCRLDYSLYTVYWGERRQDIPTHQLPKFQKCVNWNRLHQWMINRSGNTDMLVGP
ncbi:hypothetical protein F4803DRAFT_573357 [Xylaria telfairii]|nr:hypothetical protein F4803DRAFT_573357 [Xylaria telfairii]